MIRIPIAVFVSILTIIGFSNPIIAQDDDAVAEAEALKPIDMEVWQNEEERYRTIDSELGSGDLALGTPVEGYLAWFDQETETYDVGRKSTFLFRTSDGTCGAILYRSQVTEIKTLEAVKILANEMGVLPDNVGFRSGVRFDHKLITEPSD